MHLTTADMDVLSSNSDETVFIVMPFEYIRQLLCGHGKPQENTADRINGQHGP